MYILSAQPLNFSCGFGWRSVSSAARRRIYPESCSGRIWKNGRKEDVPYMAYRLCWKDLTNSARRGNLNLPQVCSRNADLNEKSKIEESIEYIKKMLQSIDDGRISISPYDTAWIALIKDLSDSGIPQFPATLEWIAKNQLSDGSWGDENFFLAYDRLLNTVACVVALESWNVYPNKREKGILFVKENISKLEDTTNEHMTCGFEVLFPALLQRARNLGIEGLPYDAPVTQKIFATRDQILERISKAMMDKVPASLLLILEGLEDLEWQKLFKLQSPNGSFLNSPSTAAFAFMETKDENCLKFIKKIVEKFNGGAPHAYPVDIFARLWAVDRLERLGISQFFDSEIEDCLSYIYRFWKGNGVFSGRESEFCDINDTSMGFRLLRLHGYNVNPNVFINFKKDKKFSLYGDQMVESPSPIFNLYRASQVQFPGETILEEAKEFSHNYLQESWLGSNQLLDKCLISKHLPNEIKYGLEMPWYASLPRVEARYFIEHYSIDEVWIGKSLYRMPDFNNDTNVELAKLDYNRCQAQHQMEWNLMQQWYEDYSVEEFGISKKELLLAYFLAAASIFEPERSGERLAWVKSQILYDILSTYYFIKEAAESSDQRIEFYTAYREKIHGKGYKNIQKIIIILFETLHQLKKDAQERIGSDISDLLHEAWGGWLKKLGEGAEERQEVELLVRIINICAGHIVSKEILSHNEYKTLSALANKICHQLRQLENEKMIGLEWMKTKKKNSKMYMEIDKKMQLLVQLVLQDSSNGTISKDIKQTFLVVAKTFYYRAYFPTEQIENHTAKVLFEQLV